ncbi:MAG: VWA domain-containing protein [Candidatus Cyclobacteriaceae bacterium M2_1C_046]
MNRLNIFFEYSAFWIIPAVFIAAFFAYLLYRKASTFDLNVKKTLGILRFSTLLILLLLLLSPIIKQIINYYEQPLVVLAIDNSTSITQASDSAAIINKLIELKESLGDDYKVEIKTLNEDYQELENINFSPLTTDLNNLFSRINNDYENRNLASVVLISDGIYNQGLNPVYSNYTYPVYTLGVGDTTHYTDIGIHQLRYNKLSYQGNKIPLQVEIAYDEFEGKSITATIYHKKKKIAEKTVSAPNEEGMSTEIFLIDAKEQGMQRYDVAVSSTAEEKNTSNNYKSAFIDVVEGKKKILLIAPFPHPDIKAIEGAITVNENYELIQYIPVLNKKSSSEVINQPYDLVILHQLPHRTLLNDPVYKKFSTGQTAKWWITGTAADLQIFNQQNDILQFSRVGNQMDQVTAYFNSGFNAFNLSEELKGIFNELPPVVVPFGNVELSGAARVFLYQQVGRVQTTKPLFITQSTDDLRSGVFLGDGLWRWKLYEYNKHQSHERFNELILKTVQYLSTKEDKRLFRFYPVKNEFNEGEPAVFETEVYNEIYEQVYGQSIQITLTTPDGEKRNYQFVTSENNTRYSIRGLQPGIYKYRAQTTYNTTTMEASGEFAVNVIDIEDVRLTADYNLLRELSSKSGGDFYIIDNTDQLISQLEGQDYKDRIQSAEDYLPLINVEWIAILLLILISTEWISRKYHGAY